MQPPSDDSLQVQRNRLRNPLLSVADMELPFENLNIMLVPVTPATPAVLQDEPAPAADNSFAGQQSPNISSPYPSSYPNLSPSEPSLQQPPQQQKQEPPAQPQPQKQGYFSSILSSLPNLSLSVITGDDSRQQHQQHQQHQQQQQQQQQQQNPVHGSAQGYSVGPYGAPPNPTVYQGGYGNQSGVGDFNAGISPPPLLQQPPPPQQTPPQPPPAAFPPSGGTGSYRLGNQRRLKYAPPPDLTSPHAQKQQYQGPPLPSFPNQATSPSAPPTFFNPNAQSLSPIGPRIDAQDSPSVPVRSGPPSSQGSSLHGSFRSSPVATPTASYPSAYTAGAPPRGHLQLNSFASTPQSVPPRLSEPVTPQDATEASPFSGYAAGTLQPGQQQFSSFSSAPQSIPSRLPEPATPQNTPADVAFSGFHAYRQQQATQDAAPGFGFGEPAKSSAPVVGQLEAIKEGNVAGSDKSFTPISAAKVTEKLENLIAEQNDDTQSVQSELSAEVATITASIPQAEKKPQPREELTEIDLNTSSSSDILLPAEDKPEPPQQSLDSFTVPSATSFFVSPSGGNQNVPSFYNSSFQAQQPISDPFSFVQSNSSTDSGKFGSAPSWPPPSAADKADSNVNLISPVPESSKAPGSSGNADLSQSIWGSNQSQGHSTVLNPVYGTPIQSAPTFFNPSQFSGTTFQPNIQVPASSSNSVNPQLPVVSHDSFNAVPEPTGSATLNPVQMSVNPLTSRLTQETVPPSLENLAAGLPEKQMQYRPVYHHWFYRREVETKTLWLPFSMHDSLNLEEVHNSNEISPETKVATDGGRYDVEILRRQRAPVYWSGPVTEVRRCSWFYKGPAESRYAPYEESVAARLEEEFKQACTTNVWNRRLDLNNGEYIMLLSPTVQVHYLQATTPELAASWGNNTGATSRPRVVKRGMDEFNIDDGEPEKVDHLLFLVHGIGSVCDLKFRTVEEVVDEFRSISLQLVQSHYRNSSEQGIVNRIEVLPISWHATLHSGIDKKLQIITLESIPKLRHFTNDTLLDILFYTSPIYCETIMQTVGNEMNRLFSLFKQRNSDFEGNVYLGGHSLGSLILFDLLCHQKPPAEEEQAETNGDAEENNLTNVPEGTPVKSVGGTVLKRKLSKKVSYMMGTAGTGQPYINYPQLAFNPRAFFALGSPIGMFVTVRGIDTLGEDFALPTCPAFFNIFHPFDPVAYRVESLINAEAHKYRPMLIPHHKGRKRMHLELKETMARVGADLKQKLLESVRSTWNSVYQLAMFHRQDNQTLELEIEKVVEEQMNNPPSERLQATINDDAGADLKVGKLNGGRRIDYVLQEAPFEYINEYLFALTSHVCYWESEDTMLMILKEIYGSMGIQTDAQLPQQSLSIERVSTPSISACPSNVTSPTNPLGVDPTAPISSKPVGPPPTTGFVKKS